MTKAPMTARTIVASVPWSGPRRASEGCVRKIEMPYTAPEDFCPPVRRPSQFAKDA